MKANDAHPDSPAYLLGQAEALDWVLRIPKTMSAAQQRHRIGARLAYLRGRLAAIGVDL